MPELSKNLSEKYDLNGSFTFRPTENLQNKCNAPTDKGGVYLIYKIIDASEVLIYIGSSGQKKDGKLKVRESRLGGMKDRLVNGYHSKFGKVSRKKAFPNHMKQEDISEIKIYWWVTHDQESGCADFPTDVEKELSDEYKRMNDGKMPEWHK